MDRTYRRPSVWAGLVALAAARVLVAGAGTSVAAGAPWLARTVEPPVAGPAAKGAGYGATDRVEAIGLQALRGMAVSSVVAGAAAGARTVSLMLALGVTAVGLLLGALCGALAARAHATRGSAGSAGPEQEHDRGDVVGNGQGPQVEPPIAAVMAGGPRESLRAVGYVSVPNSDDAAALEAQADAIQRLCERRGWELLQVVRDVEKGHAKGTERPGLLYALERVAEGDAACLVVSHLERLSRSAADLGRIIEWIDQHDGRLVAIDLRLDTGSAQGRLTARTLIAIGQWEGRRIADQTKKGLAAARARRATTGPLAVEDRPGLKEYIVTLRNAGMTLQAIADRLNAKRIPTLRGGTEWRQSSVQAAVGYRRPKSKGTILKRHRKKDEA